MSDNDLLRLTLKPACQLLAFPMAARIGKIRNVASKMLGKSTERHADWYRRQVTEALDLQLASIGLSNEERHIQLRAFWGEVESETVRLCCARVAGDNSPKGAA